MTSTNRNTSTNHLSPVARRVDLRLCALMSSIAGFVVTFGLTG